MATVFREYERRKAALGRDRLRGPARAHDPHVRGGRARARRAAGALRSLHGRRVPGRQPAPADAARALARRRATTLCAVGDDYQSIYGFTGASPEWLLGLARRFPQATVVRLEENYRSTPQVLALANRLVPRLGGAEKTLRATRPEGPEPELRGFDSPEAEGAFVLERVRELHAEGVPYEEMAVLIRLNARSVDFEELFADAQVPFQGAALLARDGARQLLKALRGAASARCPTRCGGSRRSRAWSTSVPDKVGERELVRQADLARLVQAGRGVRRRHEDGRAVGRVAARAVRPRRAGRRAPADAPPREGARVRGGLPAAGRGEGAAVQGGHARARADRRGAAAALRRHDAREAAPRADLVRQAEPVPARARRRGGTTAKRKPGARSRTTRPTSR